MDILMTCLEVNAISSTSSCILLRFLYTMFNLKLTLLDTIWKQVIL